MHPHHANQPSRPFSAILSEWARGDLPYCRRGGLPFLTLPITSACVAGFSGDEERRGIVHGRFDRVRAIAAVPVAAGGPPTLSPRNQEAIAPLELRGSSVGAQIELRPGLALTGRDGRSLEGCVSGGCTRLRCCLVVSRAGRRPPVPGAGFQDACVRR